MKPLISLAALAALAACSSSPRPSVPDRIINRALAGAPGQAQPSDVVATEIAFARMAREKGQWTAFAEYAADEATMFVPEAVNARQWLKGRSNPAQSVAWQPHQVWMSCDGSMAVTKGAWQRPDGSQGYFTTIWQRQKNREYRWVLDQGDVLAEPLIEPEFIQTDVADCGSPGDIAATIHERASATGRGASVDGTLAYQWAVFPDQSRVLEVHLGKGAGFAKVLSVSVTAPAG